MSARAPASGPSRGCGPGARLGAKARIGNFVEIKNAELGAGAKVNHLTYLGDATVGAGANIGAGTITCNYDGFGKHRTMIGEGAFIGTNSSLVAPVDDRRGRLYRLGLGDHRGRAGRRARPRPGPAGREGGVGGGLPRAGGGRQGQNESQAPRNRVTEAIRELIGARSPDLA